jgi:hypothetical protein
MEIIAVADKPEDMEEWVKVKNNTDHTIVVSQVRMDNILAMSIDSPLDDSQLVYFKVHPGQPYYVKKSYYYEGEEE